MAKTIKNDKVYKKYEKKIKRNQRKLSRRKEGSKNGEKQRIKLAKKYIRKLKISEKIFCIKAFVT
jgi:putative transposase